MTNVNDVITQMEIFAPLELREEGDPTGFQIGDKNAPIRKVMTTLDVRPLVVEEAIENNVDLIVSHHPIMFRSAKNLDLSNPQNKMYSDILSNNISVYSSHTNTDNADGGMNDWLMEQLGFKNIQKFRPGSNLGRFAELDQATTIEEFANKVAKSFKVPNLRYIKSEIPNSVKKVALIGGDAGKFYPDVLESGADTFITGDVYYHTAQDMQSLGLNVIDPGHNIEKIFIDKIADKLGQWNSINNWNIEVIRSKVITEPYNFL
ncbi:Nif3-like dinuclear metal center hexameric protein [Lactobacillus terrae]|uniref:Nif3-like dinuclear metal center hexameric protein n=1 Tax=Lactobacillus terrae TaxID=2269374 RepID=UPI000C1B6D49|nr:Nif3-like dinuclear metal center hexameric protein [Lactobacillus terrae]